MKSDGFVSSSGLVLNQLPPFLIQGCSPSNEGVKKSDFLSTVKCHAFNLSFDVDEVSWVSQGELYRNYYVIRVEGKTLQSCVVFCCKMYPYVATSYDVDSYYMSRSFAEERDFEKSILEYSDFIPLELSFLTSSIEWEVMSKSLTNNELYMASHWCGKSRRIVGDVFFNDWD